MTEVSINLIWVIIAAISLLISIALMIAKYNREAERFESWLKTHEKEISELKKDNKDINQEHKRLESMIQNIAISLGRIDTKLEILLSDRPNHFTNSKETKP